MSTLSSPRRLNSGTIPLDALGGIIIQGLVSYLHPPRRPFPVCRPPQGTSRQRRHFTCPRPAPPPYRLHMTWL